jgi:lipoprotein NlpI
VDGQEDQLEQAIATCNKELAAPDLSDDLRAQLLNARATFYCQAAQYDLAIADHSEAIRLRPGIPLEFMERAACYIGKRDFKSALADYDEAIRLAPGAAGYYQKRAYIRVWPGDSDGALADYDQVYRLAPQLPGLVDTRARLLFGMGRFHEAAEQFVVSARLTPTNPYPVLWLHMARARAHEPDDAEFQQGIKRLDLSGWPAPVFDMFLGKTTPDAMREAYSGSSYGPADGNCGAVFFAGEYELLKNDPERAKDYFAEGTGACEWSVTQQRDDFRFLDDWAELIRLNPAARGNGPLW